MLLIRQKGKMYVLIFNLCGRFNRNLYKKSWLLKSGGTYKRGESGNYHNFALSSVYKIFLICITLLTVKIIPNSLSVTFAVV